MLAAASIWVAGPVLLKLLSDVHSSSRVAFMTACTILILSGLHAFRASLCSGPSLQNLTNFATNFAWGFAILGAVPAFIIGGLMQTDAVSVALIGGWFIFLIPALAWLLRKQELDGGFFLIFIFASTGICTLLSGRIRWAEATILGDLLLILGAFALIFGFMRAPQCAEQKQTPLHTTLIQVSGAALFFTGLAAASEFNWFRLITADDFPLIGILAAALAAYWSTTYWAKHEFNWNEWPILLLAALFLIGVVLAKTVFVEALNTGEMICIGLVTIMVSTAHWLRRWLRS